MVWRGPGAPKLGFSHMYKGKLKANNSTSLNPAWHAESCRYLLVPPTASSHLLGVFAACSWSCDLKVCGGPSQSATETSHSLAPEEIIKLAMALHQARKRVSSFAGLFQAPGSMQVTKSEGTAMRQHSLGLLLPSPTLGQVWYCLCGLPTSAGKWSQISRRTPRAVNQLKKRIIMLLIASHCKRIYLWQV